MENYVKKGSTVLVEGKITTRQWTDQSGNKRYTTEIKADGIQLVGKKDDSEKKPASPQQPQYQPQTGYDFDRNDPF